MRRLLGVLLSTGLLCAAAGPADAAPPGYPPLRWLPAAAENFTVGRGGSGVSSVVIHATEGSYAGAISWFRDPRAGLSAHYVIRASDGEIAQLVAEADTAFHARGFNRSAIGIEHEFDPDHGIGYTDALYRSSASLVCAITRRYGIPADRAHIRGHSELPGTDHTDPGPAWDWSRYMSLVGACAGPIASPQATLPAGTDTASAPCRSAACVPEPGLGDGAIGPAVSLLQSDLVSLGRMAQATVQGGGGRFGPRTIAAVRTFQEDNGLPATGFYGPLTAAALSRDRRLTCREQRGRAHVRRSIGRGHAAPTRSWRPRLPRDRDRLLRSVDPGGGATLPARSRDPDDRERRAAHASGTGPVGPLSQDRRYAGAGRRSSRTAGITREVLCS